MNVSEAKQLAARVESIGGARVLGAKRLREGVALVLLLRGRRVMMSSGDSLPKLAKLLDVHGHGLERLNLCADCNGPLRSLVDGHYHQHMGYEGAEVHCHGCEQIRIADGRKEQEVRRATVRSNTTGKRLVRRG